MSLIPSDMIEVRRSPGRGRGVFARKFIPKGTIIERVPMIVFPEKELESDDGFSTLYHYCFEWGKGTVALAMGYGSIYNHSYSPNARYDDLPQRTKEFTALKDIQAGEEITISYNGEPDDLTPMEFEVM
ncbi:MAG: SET domain-containing protein [Planctomycetia bacterium]|nr:SET domain-containing protein [Planctomycetia bacterium]